MEQRGGGRPVRTVVVGCALVLALSGCDWAAVSELMDEQIAETTPGTGRATEPGADDDGAGDVPAEAGYPQQHSDRATTDAVALSAIEQELLDLLNDDRRRAGLTPLVADAALTADSRAWSYRMADEEHFRHDTSGGFAENIAYGYPTAAGVHEAWTSSPGHRDNRMDPMQRRYGVGVAAADDGTVYVTERLR
jgi:uncharacterized protein YkwD